MTAYKCIFNILKMYSAFSRQLPTIICPVYIPNTKIYLKMLSKRKIYLKMGISIRNKQDNEAATV